MTKLIPSEKLEELQKFCLALYEDECEMEKSKDGEWVSAKDLRALIDAEPERISVCNLWVNPDNLNYEVDHCNHPIHELIPVCTAPQDNLIAELVEALSALVDKELFCTDREITGGIEVRDVLKARELLKRAKEAVK